jgi:hypothetical protein
MGKIMAERGPPWRSTDVVAGQLKNHWRKNLVTTFALADSG